MPLGPLHFLRTWPAGPQVQRSSDLVGVLCWGWVDLRSGLVGVVSVGWFPGPRWAAIRIGTWGVTVLAQSTTTAAPPVRQSCVPPANTP